MKIQELQKLNKLNKKNKVRDQYLLYARKSSEGEEKQMASIESQLDVLWKLAKQKDINILATFKEAKSAKAPGRQSFNQMVDVIERRDDIKGIVTWQLNRLSRNPIDTAKLQWMLQQKQIDEILTPAKTYTEFDSDLIMGVEGAMANRFIRELKINTKRGIQRKLDMGIFPGLAPVGYKNNKYRLQGEKDIVPHPKYFNLMRRIFKLALTGKYSTEELLQKAKSMGIKNSRGQYISRTRMYLLLRNPFYAGLFIYAKKLYQGSHVPMISKKEFDAVQEVLEGKANYWKMEHDYSLKGFLKCGYCNYGITAETHTKPSGLKFIYYTCTQKKKGKCKQGFAPADKLEKKVHKFLGGIKVSDKFIDWASKWMKTENDAERQIRESKTFNLQTEERKLDEKLQVLHDKWFEKKINDEDFEHHKQRYFQRKAEIKQELKEEDSNWEDWTDKTIKLFRFAKSAQDKWRYGPLEDKKVILRVIGSNLVLKDKTLEIEPRTPFLEIKRSNAKLRGSNRYTEANIRDISGQSPVWGD